MFKVRKDRSEKGKELRQVVYETLQEEMKNNDALLALEADLGGASGSAIIRKAYPDRYIQCGISEANMIGVAAGLSVEGFVPFVHSFAPFSTRRVLDQIYLSGAYAHTTINIYGSDPGFTAAGNGGTHTSFEDAAIMREIPDVLVVDAADDVQLGWIVKELTTMKGVHYFRANRKNVRQLYEPGSIFEFGKGNIVRAGTDALIIAMGQVVNDALDCAKTLSQEGIDCEVIDMFTLKPLDVELILQEAQGKKALVTFENHSVLGGLGSAVAEVLAEANVKVPFKRHGVKDRFGQVGSADFLQKEYELTAGDLYKTIRSLL